MTATPWPTAPSPMIDDNAARALAGVYGILIAAGRERRARLAAEQGPQRVGDIAVNVLAQVATARADRQAKVGELGQAGEGAPAVHDGGTCV